MSKTDKQKSRKEADGDRARTGEPAHNRKNKQDHSGQTALDYQTKAASLGTGPVPLGKRPVLYDAIDSFIRANTNFESSIPINSAIDAMEGFTSRFEIFQEPLQRQMFNLESALLWALFMTKAPKRAETEGEPAFADEYTANRALDLIADVYDVGVQSTVWEHFENSEESESDESEDQNEDLDK